MRRHFLTFLVATFVVLLLVTGVVAWVVHTPIRLASDRIEFTIDAGSSLRVASRVIHGAGVDVSPWWLLLVGRVMRVDSSIKAGSYQITRGITLLGLLEKLTRGDVTQAEIVFVEGWTFRQMRERLDQHPHLIHETPVLSEAQVMHAIGAAGTAAEGVFFPDTYLFAKRSSDLELLARAYRAMQRHLDREWQTRANDLPYRDAYQALIMASIVEKETGREADRAQIAGVFVNRLRRGMLLQTDPTVIYGLGPGFDGNLRKRDLLADTAYNTYVRSGLPPTPIAMPGLASLRAALHPSPTDALYFVARGDGSSHFSRTLDEHQQAVGRYQRGGRS